MIFVVVIFIVVVDAFGILSDRGIGGSFNVEFSRVAARVAQ